MVARRNFREKWIKRLDNSIYLGVMLGISFALCMSQYRLELRENSISEKQYVYYYEIPIIVISTHYLVDCVANFTLRGFKGVWETRPILYLEIFISTLFWYTLIYDFLLDDS